MISAGLWIIPEGYVGTWAIFKKFGDKKPLETSDDLKYLCDKYPNALLDYIHIKKEE